LYCECVAPLALAKFVRRPPTAPVPVSFVERLHVQPCQSRHFIFACISNVKCHGTQPRACLTKSVLGDVPRRGGRALRAGAAGGARRLERCWTEPLGTAPYGDSTRSPSPVRPVVRPPPGHRKRIPAPRHGGPAPGAAVAATGPRARAPAARTP